MQSIAETASGALDALAEWVGDEGRPWRALALMVLLALAVSTADGWWS